MFERISGVLGGCTLIAALIMGLAPTLAEAAQKQKQWDREPEMKIDKEKVYLARMDTTAGPIVLELYPKQAPHHVNSFVFLAKEGFYDGVAFHRVIPGFMIQGGDPTGSGGGGPGYKLKAEFNDTKHTRGILSMARTSEPDSAGSQFFIMHGTTPQLDGQYTVFGKVTEGMEAVDKIINLPRDGRDRPNELPKIKRVKIEEKKDATAKDEKEDKEVDAKEEKEK